MISECISVDTRYRTDEGPGERRLQRVPCTLPYGHRDECLGADGSRWLRLSEQRRRRGLVAPLRPVPGQPVYPPGVGAAAASDASVRLPAGGPDDAA